MSRTQQILLSIGFFIVVGVIAWLLYAVFFQTPTQIPAPNTNNGNNVNLPPIRNGNLPVVNSNIGTGSLPLPFGQPQATPTEVASGNLTMVKDVNILNPKDFVSTASGTVFYDGEIGQFYRWQNGQKVPLSDRKFYNVSTVSWSPDQQKAVLEYPDGSNILYDFNLQKQINLPQELYDFSFDSSGQNIAGKWLGRNADENWLMIGDASGSNFHLIEPLGDNADAVSVGFSPNNQIVALYSKARDANTQTIIPVGLHGENYNSFTVPGLKFESQWSPTGSSLLYSVASADNNYAPRLRLTSGTTESLGASHLDLQLNTWSYKCAFNSGGTSVFCAEPLQLPRGAGLFPEVAQGTPDVFYRIDLQSGTKIPLAIPVGSQAFYSAASVWLSPDDSLLYFIDANTNRLQSIRLK